MWLIILAFAAAIATALWYIHADNDRYMLKLLSFMLWGTTLMVLVDHAIPFVMEGGGEFFELTTEAAALGCVMLVVALGVWEAALLFKDPKGIIRKTVRS